MAACTRVAAAVVLAFATACASDEGADRAPPTATPTTTVQPPTNAADVPEQPSGPVSILPEVLTGAWSSSGANAEIAYRFVADGRFRSAEILTQPRPRGIFEFRVVQDGRAQVDGDRLLLQPTTSTTTLKDPQNPEGDYTDRPGQLVERLYTWRVDGPRLFLRDATGLELTLERQP